MNLLILGTAILLGSSFNLKNTINNHNINQFKNLNLYDKLINMGYSNEEISSFSEEKLQYFKSIELLKVERKSFNKEEEFNYYEPTTEENFYYTSDDELIQKSDFDLDEDFFTFKEEARTVFKNNNITKVKTNESRTLTININYIKVDNEYKIFVKQDLIWNQSPNERFIDIFNIGYTSDVRLDTSKNESTKLTLSYKRKDYSKIGRKHKNPKYKEKTTEQNIVETYDMSSKNFDHKVGSGIAFKFNLKKEYYSNGSSQRYYLINKTSYSNFKVTLESIYFTNSASLIGTEFQARYIHQTNDYEIDLGAVTFSFTPPYISFSTRFVIPKPKFDEGMFISVSLRF